MEIFSGYKIIISSPNNRDYVYSFERISSDRITCLCAGNIPCRQYTVTITPNDSTLSSFWPEITGGIFSEGTLFDGETGKKLPYNSDVAAGYEYYLLIQRPVCKEYARLICETSAPRWYVYDVCTNFDGEAAKFFLDYHCILTEKPADNRGRTHESSQVCLFLERHAQLSGRNSASVSYRFSGRIIALRRTKQAPKKQNHTCNDSF